MDPKRHDLLVIGAGPGGYVAAIRAAQLGLDVACVEKEKALGGTCLRIGCIPSKALLESSELYHQTKDGLAEHGVRVGDVAFDLPAMMKRKDRVVDALTRGVAGLLKKNKITRYEGHARFETANRVRVESSEAIAIEAKHVIIATGSSVRALPGVELDGDRIGTSTEALAYPDVPNHLIIIGAGAIGLELGSVWRRLGAKVTVLEYLDRILPEVDAELASEALKLFKKQGFEFQLGARVTGAKAKKSKVTVTLEGGASVEGDRLLVAAGRVPNTSGLGLETIGLALDERGRIPIDDRFRTTVPNIYAIGDVVRGAMLAHKAEDEGVACAEIIATGHGHVNYDAVPAIVYTEPEIASVGKTEAQLEAAGIAYRKGVFPLIANGRAKALGKLDGRVKILADAATDRVLGVHILGARAGDLIAEAAVAIEFGASSEDLARACHAHPTLAETIKEAALAVDGRAIHF